jgi:hypothetical protein
MNLGLKSGTNDLHGSAYYFTRNSAVDARNYFDVAPSPVSALIMHQFGVSLRVTHHLLLHAEAVFPPSA